MIVDTSAVLAILQREPEAELFADLLLADDQTSMSAASYLEAGVVVDGYRNPVLSRALDDLLAQASVAVVDVTAGQARIARSAYRDFGRGSGSPARLNFGDCFAYALAIERAEPLLFTGQDFVHTDVRVASAPHRGGAEPR